MKSAHSSVANNSQLNPHVHFPPFFAAFLRCVWFPENNFHPIGWDKFTIMPGLLKTLYLSKHILTINMIIYPHILLNNCSILKRCSENIFLGTWKYGIRSSLLNPYLFASRTVQWNIRLVLENQTAWFRHSVICFKILFRITFHKSLIHKTCRPCRFGNHSL